MKEGEQHRNSPSDFQESESFPGKYFLIVFVILFQKFRRVQSVRTFFLTGITMFAVFNLFHFLLPFRSQIRGKGGTTQEQGHAGTVVDLDTGRAGRTVTTAATEFAFSMTAESVSSMTGGFSTKDRN